MKRVMTCAVSVLALGLSLPGCAAASASHGVLASAQNTLLSTIASSLGMSSTSPPDVGGSSAASNLDGNTGNGNSVSLGAGSPTSAESSARGSADITVPVRRDTTTSGSDPAPSHSAQPHGKRRTLTWQSLIPGSIQQ